MRHPWKVHQFGEFVASTKSPVDAAALAGMTGEGVVKFAGRIVWREGKETIMAGDSWDGAADVMVKRARQHHVERIARTK